MLLLAVRHKARSTSTIWTHVFSIFSGDGRWRVALAWDPTHHTHVHMLLLPHRRSSDAPSAATSYSGWYSGTVHGTVWYSVVHTGRPTTDLCCRSLAAAERGAATASPLWATDAYPRIYISTYLRIYGDQAQELFRQNPLSSVQWPVNLPVNTVKIWMWMWICHLNWETF